MAGERGAVPTELLAVRGDRDERRRDLLAVEEPLEIRAAGPGQEGVRIAVTMRTPGDDVELATGFLYTEGLIRELGDVAVPPSRELVVLEGGGNIVTVRLTRSFDAEKLRRNFYATSSCGICGKASIESVEVGAPALGAGVVVTRDVLARLPGALRGEQAVFERTGGLHGAGLFTRTGELVHLREDVGRHNAVDKLVGRALLDGALPLSESVLMVSGRASFELVQKAAMAGITVFAAVSAPSSLAVSLAERVGMTVVGFLRDDGFNVYTRPERVDLRG